MGRTAFYHAIASNSYDTTRLLIALGADVFIVPLVGTKLINLSK